MDYLTENLFSDFLLEEEYLEYESNLLIKRLNLSEDYIFLEDANQKNFFKELMKKIKVLWDKFIEKTKNVMKLNEKWIKTHEQIILNTDLSKMKWNMFPYWKGVKYIEKLKIPNFNPNDKKQLEYTKTPESFKQFLIDTYLNGEKKVKADDKFIESLEYVFKGGEAVVLSGSDLSSKVKGFLDFCKNYSFIMQKLKQDKTNIDKCSNYAISHTDSIKNANKQESFNFLEDNQFQGAKKSNEDLNKANQQIVSKIKTDNSDLKNNTEKKDFANKNNMSTNINSDTNKNFTNYIKISHQILCVKKKVYEERYDKYMELLKTIVDIKTDKQTTNENKEKNQ